jgi:hypothetical protein
VEQVPGADMASKFALDSDSIAAMAARAEAAEERAVARVAAREAAYAARLACQPINKAVDMQAVQDDAAVGTSSSDTIMADLCRETYKNLQLGIDQNMQDSSTDDDPALERSFVSMGRISPVSPMDTKESCSPRNHPFMSPTDTTRISPTSARIRSLLNRKSSAAAVRRAAAGLCAPTPARASCGGRACSQPPQQAAASPEAVQPIVGRGSPA